MNEIFRPVEDLPESIQFRYMVESANNLEELIESDIEEAHRWRERQGTEIVFDLFRESEGYEELRKNVEKKIDFLHRRGANQESNYIREYFSESAEAFLEEIQEDSLEWVMSELSYTDGDEYVREFKKSWLSSDEDGEIHKAVKESETNYEMARNLRKRIKKYEEDRYLDEEKLERNIVETFWELG